MRRPTLCGDVRAVDPDADDVACLHREASRTTSRTTSRSTSDRGSSYGQPQDVSGQGLQGLQGHPHRQGLGRLSRVKRLITDSLLGGRGGRGASVAAGPAASKASKANKQFGIPLCDVALTKDGVPVVVAKICSYLENHGLQSEGLFQSSSANHRLADGLRASLDLEGSGDVFSTALLLLMWLKELPEPIVWGHVAAELLSVHDKVSEESVGTWRQAIRLVLCTLPETNLRLLRYILRFLHRYNQHQQQRTSKNGPQSMLSHLGSIFAPLLLLRGFEYYGAEQLSRASILTSRLIQDHASVFHQWILDHPNEVPSKPNDKSPMFFKKNNLGEISRMNVEDTENASSSQHRKRKERNESANSNQSHDRKVIRSSSAERHIELTFADKTNESIRRVSSHEDFSRVKQKMKASTCNKAKFTTVVELSDQPPAVHLPLHECNHIDSPIATKDVNISTQIPVQDSGLTQKENELLRDQPYSIKARDRYPAEIHEDEHEKRRSCERFSRSLLPPRSVARRNVGRKKRTHHSSSTLTVVSNKSVKDQDDKDLFKISSNKPDTTVTQHPPDLPDQNSLSSEEQDDDLEPAAEIDSLSDESRPGSSHSFLQLHPPERERSPSPSISPCTPPLDLTTLHQSVDSSEPVASRVGWDYVRPQHQEEDAGRGILLSPRNSMILSRRVFMDHNIPPSPPGDHHGSCLVNPALDVENVIKKMNKQIASIKKKLKRYEEGFERELGYRPSQSDKMANKDIKKLCTDLSHIRKELKEIKENPLSAMNTQSEARSIHHCVSGLDGSTGLAYFSGIEDTVAEVERRLKEKRRIGGRPESIDDMSPEEHAAEKLAMQKALLLLEKICGRASSKQDREIVRPLYDRYRTLKRIVARAGSSKLKDSINELETIHEHEAMDFTPSTSFSIMGDGSADMMLPVVSVGSIVTNASSSSPAIGLQNQPSMEETSDSQTSSSDSLGENLHALPLSDLVLQLTQTREEKKKLRRLLREQEEHFQLQTGRRMQREDRVALPGDAGAAKDFATIYSSYKQTKAKLRLLEALVAKQR
ncbi:protein FAM13B [Thrips palmi]|uniref:Protein FAM13B n=1 Tax=Thrips palmi TaxID=161013 RepID=A0A6P8YEA1_THRPL|nr:protein FAM13B [Thrips palmi]